MNLVPSGMTEKQMKKAQEGVEVLPTQPVVKEYTGEYFKTTFKNNRPGPCQIMTDSGGPWIFLNPGKEITLDSWSARTLYAPYSRVTFEKGGKVSVARRFGFKDPVEEAPYSLLLDNREGGELEAVRINDEYVSAIKGIPRRVAIPLHDRLVVYKAIVWRKRVVKEPAPGRRDYLITRTIVEKVNVPRKASEIRAIKRLLEKEAVDEARRTAAQKFGNVAGLPDDEPEVTSDSEVQGTELEG